MTLFFAGFAIGAGVALFSAWCLHKAKAKATQNAETSAKEDGLNAEKKAREEFLAELERQCGNIMNYTGRKEKA